MTIFEYLGVPENTPLDGNLMVQAINTMRENYELFGIEFNPRRLFQGFYIYMEVDTTIENVQVGIKWSF